MVVVAAEYNDGRAAAAAKPYNLLVMVFPSALSTQKRACHRENRIRDHHPRPLHNNGQRKRPKQEKRKRRARTLTASDENSCMSLHQSIGKSGVVLVNNPSELLHDIITVPM